MRIPKSMQEKYDEISSIITEFCEKYLNDEYAAVSLLLLEKLCRKRPSPLNRGKPNTWACGIVYAIGSTNFLFDKSQTPYMQATELAEGFGLSRSTAGNKAGEIYKLLNITTFDPEWTLPSKLLENPMVWMFETDRGFIFDARYVPRETQEELYKAGMIPFIPADCEENESPQDDNEPVKKNPTKRKREPDTIKGQITFDDEI